MIEAQPVPVAGAVEIRPPPGRRPELARRLAIGPGAAGGATLDPAMKPASRTRHFARSPEGMEKAYIGRMTEPFTGPLAPEITKRLTDALAPAHLEVVNDSAKHLGHAGHDGSGESHFTVDIVAPSFAGMSRIERQ